MRFIVTLSLVLLAASARAQTALPVMLDPIFHLSIPAARYTAGFAETPQSILQSCGVTVSAADEYRDWTLASAQEPSGTYYLLAGVLRDGTKPASGWTNDTNGAFVRLNGAACTAIDPADGVFGAVDSYTTDPSLPIPEKVFTDLAASAAVSFSRAYGSKSAFIAALKAQHRYPLPADQPILSAAVAAP
jgi:hypothetical protein